MKHILAFGVFDLLHPVHLVLRCAARATLTGSFTALYP